MLFCFFTILLLIVVIPSASADQLFITNLMQYPEPMVLEDSAIHAETIRSLEQQIKDEPQRTWQLRSEIATTKARQGKLTEALNDLSLLLANTKGNSSELALEERAELKSIMGFTDAALDDNSKVLLADQNWLFLWHRWLILKRGGQIKDAQETLGQALQALQRHGADNNLAKALVATGKKENCVPDNSAQIITDKALTQLKQTAQLSTPPSNKDMAIIFGLKLVDSNNGTSTFKSEKISCLWTSASAADNFHQLKLDVNTINCQLTVDAVAKAFPVKTADKMGLDRGGPGPVLYYFSGNGCQVSFGFDGAKYPTLKQVRLSWKAQAQ